VIVTGSVFSTGYINGMAGGVVYHTDVMTSASSQEALDILVELAPTFVTDTGDYGTFILTFQNRTSYSTYLLSAIKPYGVPITASLNRIAGTVAMGFEYVSSSVTQTILRIAQNVSSATHQFGSATFTSFLIGEYASKGRSAVWTSSFRANPWTFPGYSNILLGSQNQLVVISGSLVSGSVAMGINTSTPNSNLQVVGNITATSITSSLYGTSSNANFAVSSSNAVTSSYGINSFSATSASYATTSSYSITSSFARNATSAVSSTTSTSASYSTTAANLTPTVNFMGGLGTMGTQAIAISSSYVTGYTLSNITDGGQSFVKVYIGGYWVVDQKPASYYGEYILQKVQVGASPQPGMIIREVNCNPSTRRILSQIVDPGSTGSPTNITIQFMVSGSTGGVSGSIFYEKIGDQTGFPP
jgi:hypothetical protein